MDSLFSALLESAPDAILVVDASSQIVIVNLQAEKIFGYTREGLLSQSIDTLIPDRFSESHRLAVSSYLSNPKPRPMGSGLDLVAVRRDGSEFPVEISLSPVESDSGLFVAAIIRDISSRKLAEKSLKEARDELEERVRMRTAELEAAYRELQARNEELDSFSHTVAHDLKSQLALITGYAEVLQDNLTTIPQESQLRYLESIARNGYKMARVIEQLLLLANVRQSQLDTWPLEMESIIFEAQQRLAYEISMTRAKIQIASKLPVAIGNGPLVEEVWVNYLSNSLKYGGKPPFIEINAGSQPDGMVKFWVKDNGSGIQLEDQTGLFKPFTRVAGDRVAGSGLGLSIVRRIIEKLGGVVGVESSPGKGACFFFTLPGA